MGIVDLLRGLLAVKQKAKLDGDRPHFCFFFLRTKPFPSRFPLHTEYKIVASMSDMFFILCYSDVELFYTSTFSYDCTASKIPSFLLFTQSNICSDFFQLVCL